MQAVSVDCTARQTGGHHHCNKILRNRNQNSYCKTKCTKRCQCRHTVNICITGLIALQLIATIDVNIKHDVDQHFCIIPTVTIQFLSTALDKTEDEDVNDDDDAWCDEKSDDDFNEEDGTVSSSHRLCLRAAISLSCCSLSSLTHLYERTAWLT